MRRNHCIPGGAIPMVAPAVWGWLPSDIVESFVEVDERPSFSGDAFGYGHKVGMSYAASDALLKLHDAHPGWTHIATIDFTDDGRTPGLVIGARGTGGPTGPQG